MKESDAPKSKDKTADHSNKPQDGGSLANSPPSIPGNPPPPSEGGNPHYHANIAPWWRRLDTWRFMAEIFILVVTVKIACIYSDQLDQMRESVKIAHDTFVASNKPSVGINGIVVAYQGTDAKGKTVLTQGPDERTTSFGYRVEIKNFGNVAADNFVPSWKVFIDGVEQRGGGETSKPSTIFPGKSIYLTGRAGRDNYQVIMSGSKILELEVTVRYDGPSQSYAYCEKNRFGPDINAFWSLGAACTKQ